MSISMRSPSSTRPIAPPSAASGEMWHRDRPALPPENRPSVISALAALRAWAVTFLTVTIARLGSPAWLPSPTVLFTLAGPAGVAISVTGNETALWNMAIYIDSSALTAGTVQAADPHLRGATMGLHSMAGYGGGFIGPRGVGLVLDSCGGDSVAGWGLAFGHIAVITLMGLIVLRRLGRTDS